MKWLPTRYSLSLRWQSHSSLKSQRFQTDSWQTQATDPINFDQRLKKVKRTWHLLRSLTRKEGKMTDRSTGRSSQDCVHEQGNICQERCHCTLPLQIFGVTNRDPAPQINTETEHKHKPFYTWLSLLPNTTQKRTQNRIVPIKLQRKGFPGIVVR